MVWWTASSTSRASWETRSGGVSATPPDLSETNRSVALAPEAAAVARSGARVCSVMVVLPFVWGGIPWVLSWFGCRGPVSAVLPVAGELVGVDVDAEARALADRERPVDDPQRLGEQGVGHVQEG